MTSIDAAIKSHDLVKSGDITQYILAINSAKECLINYSIFEILNFSCTFNKYTQFTPQGIQSAQTLIGELKLETSTSDEKCG